MLAVIESFSNLKAARVNKTVKISLKLTKQKRKRPKREAVPKLSVKINAKPTIGQAISFGAKSHGKTAKLNKD